LERPLSTESEGDSSGEEEELLNKTQTKQAHPDMTSCMTMIFEP